MTLFCMQHMTPFQVQTLSQDEPQSGPLTVQRTPHPAVTAHAPTPSSIYHLVVWCVYQGTDKQGPPGVLCTSVQLGSHC